MEMIRHAWPKVWQRHTALTFYLALMAVLLLGVYIEAGPSYLPVNLHYLFLLLFAYAVASVTLREPFGQLAQWAQRNDRLQAYKPLLARLIDAVVLVFPFLYFASAGYVPFVRMMFMDDYYAASGLRQAFFDVLPAWANYGGEYFLRALAPVWLVYSFIHRRRVFFPALLITSAQALGVITKTSIVILLFPLLVVQLHRRAWAHAVLTSGIIVTVLILNVTVLHNSALTQMAKTEAQKVLEAKEKKRMIAEHKAFEENPSAVTRFLEQHLDSGDSERAVIEEYKALELASEGIWIRLFAVQGRIVKQWLDTYPTERGFQHGCGYRWFAPLVPCAFENLPRSVWNKYFPELREVYHLTGTVSAPHYINAYANFGDMGVLLAAIGMAAMLVALAGLFPNPVHNLAFNASFLALALQAPLFSLLNSSGWALTILLYLVFFPREAKR
ncbi:MAG: hypothetical protein ACKVOE_02020 [Rickettsiales bacterium]